MQRAINQLFDRSISPDLHICGRARPAYLMLGVVGILAGMLLGLVLAYVTGLSLVVMSLCILVIAITSYCQVFVTKLLFDPVSFRNYHTQIVIFVAATVLLLALSQPVAAYVDVIGIGVLTFIMIGRWGCLMAGCCHGRPAAWGVCYSSSIADFSTSSHFNDVRLFPLQLVESLLAGGVLIGSVMLLLSEAVSGTAFVWYVAVYASVRFFVEFLRGDTGRPYAVGLFETQWLSLVFVVIVCLLSLLGVLPYPLISGNAAFIMIAVWFYQRVAPASNRQLFHVTHIEELAYTIERALTSSGDVRVLQTSNGLNLSAQVTEDGKTLYSISNVGRPLSLAMAQKIGYLVRRLRHHTTLPQIVQAQNGVYHLIFTA